jgi:hypothetical protein
VIFFKKKKKKSSVLLLLASLVPAFLKILALLVLLLNIKIHAREASFHQVSIHCKGNIILISPRQRVYHCTQCPLFASWPILLVSLPADLPKKWYSCTSLNV